ncbi:MAG: hypothetical protein KKA05_00830 [Alphaproteobacteria bacterium]|nr:hypothetical protein [Alphaproteobacteria bacterium]
MQRNNLTPTQRHTQSGNVFFLVMIGVVLFGALMYSFSRSLRQGDTNMSSKKSVIAAQDILGLGQKIDRGVNRVLTHSCSENSLNFVNGIFEDYENPDAPADFSCDVFKGAGGSLTFTPPDPAWYDSAFATLSGHGEIIFAGNALMDNIGTQPAADLIMWVPFIKREICEDINRMLDIDTMPTFTQGPYAGFRFTGDFAMSWDNRVNPAGNMAACVREPNADNVFATSDVAVATNQSATNSYHFYQVLIPR